MSSSILVALSVSHQGLSREAQRHRRRYCCSRHHLWPVLASPFQPCPQGFPFLDRWYGNRNFVSAYRVLRRRLLLLLSDIVLLQWFLTRRRLHHCCLRRRLWPACLNQVFLLWQVRCLLLTHVCLWRLLWRWSPRSWLPIVK